MVRKLSKRERALVSVFFLILIVAMGIEFLVYPSLDKINMLKNEQADLELQWNEIQYDIGAEGLLHSQIEELKVKTEELSQQLPSAQSSHLYWEWIHKHAEQSGVKIVQIQEDKPDFEKNYRLVHLSITGDYAEIITFMEAINSMPYIHAISEGTFQRGEQLISTTLTLYISAYQDTTADQS